MLLLDLLVCRSANLSGADIFYWRTISGEEVDLVIEADGKILPIEIKAMDNARVRDAENIIAFQKEYGKKSRSELLIHIGTNVTYLTPTVLAAPW